MAKVVVLALTTCDSPHAEHEFAGRNTWATAFLPGEDIWWVLGTGRLEEPVTCTDQGVLQIPVEETFDNMLLKTVEAMRWILENHTFDYLVRTNTSTYIDRELLEQEIDALASPSVYAGPIGHWVDRSSGTSWTYVGGAGVILSRQLVSALVKMDVSQLTYLPDDVALGRLVADLGVPYVVVPRVALTDFEPFVPAWNFRAKDWHSGLKVPVQRMRDIYELLHSPPHAASRRLLAFDCSEIGRAVRAWWKHPLWILRAAMRIFLTHNRRVYKLQEHLRLRSG